MVLLWIIFMMTGMVSIHIQFAIALPPTTDSVSETSTQNREEELDEIKNNGGGEEGIEEDEEKEEEENEEKVSIEMDDDNLVVVSDMIMSVEQYQRFLTGIAGRKGVKFDSHKWPKERYGIHTIPYNISSKGSKFNKAIKDAMVNWESNTCIRFRPKTEIDESYLNFIIGKGCYSFIGYRAGKPQPVSLGSGCKRKGIAVHEIGHAIGFMHEHMRQDRDQFIRVNDMNVEEEYLHNFIKGYSGLYTNNGIKYDYTSTMHYGPKSFSKNGRFTLRTLNPAYQGLIGRFGLLSHRDKLAANIMYGCLKSWLQKCDMAEDNCENTGYIGSNCRCICAPGTVGNTCQVVIGDYYSDVMSSCNMNITKSNTIIKTPNYPHSIKSDTWCVYHIMAPNGSQILIKFVDFQLGSNCRNSYLAIMEDKAENVTDTMACGKDFNHGHVHKTTTNEVTMFLDVSKSSHWPKGFHAVVIFSTNATMTLNPVGVGILTLLLILIFMH